VVDKAVDEETVFVTPLLFFTLNPCDADVLKNSNPLVEEALERGSE
jgi:hypothetical protein